MKKKYENNQTYLFSIKHLEENGIEDLNITFTWNMKLLYIKQSQVWVFFSALTARKSLVALSFVEM